LRRPWRSREIAVGDELADDAVGGALGDPDLVADVAQAHAGIAGDAQEDLCVAGQKGPVGRRKVGHGQKRKPIV
jgi:hypothetical protein